MTDTQQAWEHGTSLGYQRRKCRCDRCRAWKRDYQRSHRGSTLVGLDEPVDRALFNRAIARLAHLHADELHALIAELKAG